MKSTVLLAIVASLATVNGLSTCVLDCQSTAGTDNCATSNYNATSCYCDNGDFTTDVRSCVESGCPDDMGDWFSYRGSQCGGGAASTTASGASATSTASIQLTSCILSCEESAAEIVGSGCTSTTYNNTACFCDSDAFASDVSDCIIEDCAGDNDIWRSYRGSICNNVTSTVVASTTATPTSSASSSSTSSSNSDDSNKGLSGGAIAGICVGSIVGGLAIIGAGIAYLFRRRRLAKAQRARQQEVMDSYKMHHVSSRASTAH